MQEQIEFVRLVGEERRVGSKLAQVSRHWQGDQEHFLMISPHDDDAVLGAGLLIQLAKRENVPVHIMIVTDGSMGYCSADEKDSIAEIRRKETLECYKTLGVPKSNIICLGFPDCQLASYRGRSPAKPDDPAAVNGFSGLQNAFTDKNALIYAVGSPCAVITGLQPIDTNYRIIIIGRMSEIILNIRLIITHRSSPNKRIR
jgi:hypothetical protein